MSANSQQLQCAATSTGRSAGWGKRHFPSHPPHVQGRRSPDIHPSLSTESLQVSLSNHEHLCAQQPAETARAPGCVRLHPRLHCQERDEEIRRPAHDFRHRRHLRPPGRLHHHRGALWPPPPHRADHPLPRAHAAGPGRWGAPHGLEEAGLPEEAACPALPAGAGRWGYSRRELPVLLQASPSLWER